MWKVNVRWRPDSLPIRAATATVPNDLLDERVGHMTWSHTSNLMAMLVETEPTNLLTYLNAFSGIDLSSLGLHFVWKAFGGGMPYLITEFRNPFRCRGLKPSTWAETDTHEMVKYTKPHPHTINIMYWHCDIKKHPTLDLGRTLLMLPILHTSHYMGLHEKYNILKVAVVGANQRGNHVRL